MQQDAGWVDPTRLIREEIERWSEESKARQLTIQARPRADELDPWLRYTGWAAVLSRSKHGLVKTYEFARAPGPEEPQLVRLLEAWACIMDRCLETLATTEHKDTLKWWASPKNESVDRCGAVWGQFLCYAMRTAPDMQDGATGQRSFLSYSRS